MKIRNPSPFRNCGALPLFAWADTHEFRPSTSYPARRLRRRFPDLSQEQANVNAELAGLGVRYD